jgi:hypothetical protein
MSSKGRLAWCLDGSAFSVSMACFVALRFVQTTAFQLAETPLLSLCPAQSSAPVCRSTACDRDRLRARRMGTALNKVHQAAVNLIRGLGYPDVPNGWRGISARTDYGLPFATGFMQLEK